jgi:hypothetical protein
MYIIVRNKNSWKGKSVTEMAKNLQSEGWPPEVSAQTLDKMKFAEKKYGPGVFKKEKNHGKV